MRNIQVAIAGVGNCASSLIQGLEFYRHRANRDLGGLMHASIGGYGRDIHIGPSDYVAWQDDNKVCFIRMEGRGFGDVPMELELRLSLQDSPNSAGVVIDAVRCAKLGLERGHAGPIEEVSAYYKKSPPLQMRDSDARLRTEDFIRDGGERSQQISLSDARASGK